MKLYIYNLETKEIVATAEGETNDDCENKAFYSDYYGMTYSPAFGANDGLIDNGDAITL